MTSHHDLANAIFNSVAMAVGLVLSIAVQALPLIQVLSGVIACVTGIFAIRYYIRAARSK